MHWREWAFPLHRSVLWVHVAFSPAAAQENARGEWRATNNECFIQAFVLGDRGMASVSYSNGAGGLGEYIFRGLSMVDSTVILAGAIPAAVLALAADGGLTWLERRLSPGRRRLSRAAAIAIGTAAVVAVTLLARGFAFARPDAIVIGSKNFTEQGAARRAARADARAPRHPCDEAPESGRHVHL